MPKYIAHTDTWISHESRLAKAGETFETKFPTANGIPMKLGANIELVAEEDEIEPEPVQGKKARAH